MAYHIDGTDIVIDGWENGISDNPYKGINDMRGVNIISVPGEVSVSFAQENKAFPSFTATVVSSSINEPVAPTIYISGLVGSFGSQAGQAVVFTGASLPTGITAGVPYWIVPQGANTFTIYNDTNFDTFPSISATGTGTVATINIGEIRYIEKMTGVALDKNGRTWSTRVSSPYYKYLGNDVTSTVGMQGTIGNGLTWYKEYLFVFYNSRISYIKLPAENPGGWYTGAAWVNEWDPVTGAVGIGTAVFNSGVGDGTIHDSLVGQDDVIYITDGHYIASLFQKAGSVFNPANTATYTWNKQALYLAQDKATCLEELGKNLMIGGEVNYIYPWDRISTSFTYPIKIADNYIFHLLTVNTNMYIFAGRRGRIYVTNGSQANIYTKVPDHISGIEPIFEWKNCCYNKNQIYFGVLAKDNSKDFITSYYGLWAIDVSTNALRVANIQSSNTATVTAIYAFNSIASGFGLAVAFANYDANGNFLTAGIDTGTENPYTTYISSIETDLIPVGQFLKKRTFENLEFKLSVPMVNNEGIKISYRPYKSSSYTQIGETLGTSTSTPISDFYTVNFDQSQWVQFKIEMKSTNTNPSYVRLNELRLRGGAQQ